MIQNNILAEKSTDFGVRIVRCYQFLTKEKKEYVLSKQIYRSGTSIGANVHEALYAQSKADFASKLSIALKEASETAYWLTILYRTFYISSESFSSLKTDVEEIIRIIIASLKITRRND